MSAANGTALRPLTPIEEKAVQLAKDGIPLSGITAQTRLTADLIAVALDRHTAWEKLRSGAKPARAYTKLDAPERVAAELNPPPTDCPTSEVSDVPPVPVAEPDDVDWAEVLANTPGEGLVPDEDGPPAEEDHLYIEDPEPEPAVSDSPLERLLARAEASPQPRARQLATAVRAQLAELEQVLDRDEQVRTLTIAAEVLRRQLATTEAELSELLGTDAVPAGAEPSAPASPSKASPAAPKDGQAAYSTTVRQWAGANGWDVKPFGRMPGAVVAAYEAAHGGAS